MKLIGSSIIPQKAEAEIALVKRMHPLAGEERNGYSGIARNSPVSSIDTG
jgi:hypothetical protein